MDHVIEALGVSERKACRALGQPRSSQRYQAVPASAEEALTADIIELASQYGRYGYRRITAMLRRLGWKVNHKRVERIWRREGLKVPRKQPKRGRLWLTDGSCVRLRPAHRNHVWAYDFVAARTHDGRPFRILTIIDEYTRECLAIKVARSIRSDNGPEITARVVRNWLPRVGASPLFIEPGSPWENGYVESFNGKLRDEFLDREIFYTLKEAQVLIEQWRKLYNEIRPHSALGYKPPAPATMLSRSEWSSLLPLTSTTPRLAVSGLT